MDCEQAQSGPRPGPRPGQAQPRKVQKKIGRWALRQSREAEAAAFEKFVSPEPNTGCWLWTGSVDRDGYGLMRFNAGFGRATSTTAHRAMWQFRNGPLRLHQYACHSCDTPACVNPDHVWPGTPAQNQSDCKAKGRQRSRCARMPDHQTLKRGKVADAEAAAADPAVPRDRARRFLEYVYRKRKPEWLRDRLERFEHERSNLSRLNGRAGA